MQEDGVGYTLAERNVLTLAENSPFLARVYATFQTSVCSDVSDVATVVHVRNADASVLCAGVHPGRGSLPPSCCLLLAATRVYTA